MTALGSEEFEEEEGECEMCQGPATRICENCYIVLCDECPCPLCGEDEEEPCDRCSKLDADTYDCEKCWRIVCHGCFSFEKGLCVDCASGERR
jgi:hypothetical protein